VGLRGRLRRLERHAPIGGTLQLPDGTEVRYGPEEMLGALCAAMDGREHRLLPYLRSIPSEGEERMPALIRAIEGDPDNAA
jgi:hypothetical protein